MLRDIRVPELPEEETEAERQAATRRDRFADGSRRDPSEELKDGERRAREQAHRNDRGELNGRPRNDAA